MKIASRPASFVEWVKTRLFSDLYGAPRLINAVFANEPL